jgi:glycine oxidase
VKTWDVIIVGGGIIGLSLSIALRKRGANVLVVERGEPGREASHAAGGMLVDCPLETPAALQELATASACMYPEFVHELEVESGMKVDLREYGTILFPAAEHLRNAQPGTIALDSDHVREREPEIAQLNPDQARAFEEAEAKPSGRFPSGSYCGEAFYLKERSVDPRALTAAAVKAAKHRGVDFSSGDEVIGVETEHGSEIGVKTSNTVFAARRVVNCAGAWAGAIGPYAMPTRPVKGQMLCLVMPSRSLIKHVIRSPSAYLIPRSDGRLLVGATVEEAGFEKRTDPDTIQRLHKSALALVPKLAEARILEDWAGLRPGTPDALPILGATPIPDYFVATGHFRDGILLAPITAQIMADVIEGRNPAYDLKAFSPARFG